MKEEIIEKGKWNDGDINPKNPNLVWVASAAGGKGDWRKVKKTKTPVASAPAAKTATSTSQAAAASKDEGGKKTATQKYDAPTPKITYKTKKPADGVVFEVPEEWKTKDSQGQIRTQHRDTFRKLYSDTAKMLICDLFTVCSFSVVCADTILPQSKQLVNRFSFPARTKGFDRRSAGRCRDSFSHA